MRATLPQDEHSLALDEVAGIARHACGTAMAAVIAVGQGESTLLAAAGVEALSQSQQAALAAACAGAVLEADSASRSSTLGQGGSNVAPVYCEGTRLLDASGQPAGVLCVMDSTPQSLTTEQQEALRKLGRLAEALLEERAAAERKSDSEERYRQIFESARDGILILDAQSGCIEEANAYLGRLLGIPSERLIGQPLWSSPLAELAPDASTWSALREGGRHQTELSLTASSGQPLPVELVFHGHKTAGKAVVQCHIRDISERSLAELALAESEARFRFLTNLGDTTRSLAEPREIMQVVAELLGKQLRASRCAYAEVEAGGNKFTICDDYTDGCQSTAGQYQLSLFGPRVYAKMRSGRTLVVRDVDSELAPDEGAAMFNAIGIGAIICCPLLKQGELTAMMAVHQTTARQWTASEVALVEEVVERCWAFIERARTEQVLRRSEERRFMAIEAGGVGDWEVDARTNKLQWSRRTYTLMGLQPQADITLDSFYEATHPDDRDRIAQSITLALDPQGDGLFREEFRSLHPSGQELWLDSRGRSVFEGAEGERHAVLFRGTLVDITERKAREAENAQLLQSEQEARREAEATNRIKDEFLATLSHELRTPLNAILGWSHLLRSGKLDGEGSERALDTIERNARAQVQLIEDLLDVSRIITGNLRLEVRPVELPEIIQAAVDAVRPAADAKSVRLQVLLDPQASPVSGDFSRLQQVVWNLLTNAVKFTPRGGRVQVLVERVHSHIEIVVSDTGQGITPDFLPHIFDRFRQADQSSTRGHGGLGLGLSIVHHLVELHGGTIVARSPGEGHGSTFVVQLPLMAVRHDDGDERRHPRAGGAFLESPSAFCPPELDGLRVLVVDDEADTRDLLRALLEQCGSQVMACGSAAQGVESFKEWRPQVVISDIGMPREDGYAMISQIRAWEALHGGRVPAIALTAYARVEDRVQALRAGFQVHVPKPIEPVELVAVVASLTGHTP